MLRARSVGEVGGRDRSAGGARGAWAGVGLDRGLRALAALWVGVMAGFFWAFSVVVMPGLAEAEPAAGMAAMRAINEVVGNPVFFAGFFGAPLLCALAGARAARRRDGPAAWLALAGAAVYVLGVFAVTVAFNLPLNDELAGRDPADPAQAAGMAAWIRDWNRPNDVRTGSGLVAFVLLTGSLLLTRAPGRADGAPA